MKNRLLALSICLLLYPAYITVEAQSELNVLKDAWLEYSDAPNSLYHHLTRQAYIMLDTREKRVSEINSLDEWKQRQVFIKETLYDLVGPFPDKTPLNASTVRTINKGSYRIEHVIFESQPGFRVTSSVFIPAGLKNAKAPAIIYCSGHSADGYRGAVYQHVILNLVKKGFIVFAFDPVGQGERLEYYDPAKGASVIGGPTKEHSYPGSQAFLTGSSQAMYMIWDGIRSVDYLLTRKDVDPSRIGITGRSGGGTQSACIAAMDERIYAAAPENYITNYRRLLQSIGPQDAEQNIFNLICRGLDHPDFLIVRAPRPALMITTTRDMFSIQGAMETEHEVKGIYKAYGKVENFMRAEDDAAHASTKMNRETMYAFFQKHLNNPGNSSDEEIQVLTADELRVTPTGQISVSPGSETVYSLNRKMAERLESKLNEARKDPAGFIPSAVNYARKLSGFIDPGEPGLPVFAGRILKENYSIEKYFIKGEMDYVVPYLLFKPVEQGNRAIIYLHPSGKAASASADGEIEKLLKLGITVLAPDLLGIGELGQGVLKGDANFEGISHNLWYASILIGRSIAGIQSADIIRLVRVLKRENSNIEVSGYAHGSLSSVLLCSAAFSDELTGIVLESPYTSFFSITESRFYKPEYIMSSVAGALKHYDLPDLAASIAPRKLFIANPVDAQGKNDNTDRIMEDLSLIKSGYESKSAVEHLKIVFCLDEDYYFYQLGEWLTNNNEDHE